MKRAGRRRLPRGDASDESSGGVAAVTRWLLDGPAQLRSGSHAGAVAGALQPDGRATYAYPEITGYYLQWLAWKAANGVARAPLAARAAAAQRWVAGWLAGGDPPPTRIPMLPAAADWRNDASFFFDVAMVLRGIGSAARHALLAPDPAVVSGLSRELRRLVGADGAFEACVLRNGAAPLPDRWSTRRGGFLAKAAAGVVTASRALPGVATDVVAAAEASYQRSVDAALATPHDDAHPLLYTFEGVLALPRHPRFRVVLPAIAGQFDALLADVRTSGWIRESRVEGTRGPRRLDVAAQAMRAGQLLAAHLRSWSPDRGALARLNAALTGNVGPDGAVPFAVGQAPPCANVWAAMFADQAWGMRRAGLRTSHDDPLLV